MANFGENNPVWYVCYGSNLLWSRFERYITGCRCQENNKVMKAALIKPFPQKMSLLNSPINYILRKNLVHGMSWVLHLLT